MPFEFSDAVFIIRLLLAHDRALDVLHSTQLAEQVLFQGSTAVGSFAGSFSRGWVLGIIARMQGHLRCRRKVNHPVVASARNRLPGIYPP